MPVNVTIRRKPRGAMERAFEAALKYADAESDDDHFRAKDNLRKAIAACAPEQRAELDRELVSRLTKEGMARVRAAGVPLGRPSKVHPALVTEAVRAAGSASRAAAALRVSKRTIFRALRRLRGGASNHP